MPPTVIRRITTRDARFQLKAGEGVDAIHSAPQYAYAVALLHTDGPQAGSGLAFTLGGGNDLVCRAIEVLAAPLVGHEIEELMADFGNVFYQIAEHHQLRWLGPHKGVVHLALAALTNACFDLWAKARGLPLWQLLLDLTPQQVIALLDLSYLEDVLTGAEAVALLEAQQSGRAERAAVLTRGYPGYDTSVGWFHYSDEQVRENARRALDAGFSAMKLKVGSQETTRDVRRAHIVREAVGPDVRVMLDANQQWTSPIAIAAGEHLPNRILFKNYLQAGAARFIQVDCVRVGGVSEFITISLLARKFGAPVVPHVGDMGQIHQHLVLFNHIALGHEAVFLEYIPHLREHFAQPAEVAGGVYRIPEVPGSSSDLKD